MDVVAKHWTLSIDAFERRYFEYDRIKLPITKSYGFKRVDDSNFIVSVILEYVKTKQRKPDANPRKLRRTNQPSEFTIYTFYLARILGVTKKRYRLVRAVMAA